MKHSPQGLLLDHKNRPPQGLSNKSLWWNAGETDLSSIQHQIMTYRCGTSHNDLGSESTRQTVLHDYARHGYIWHYVTSQGSDSVVLTGRKNEADDLPSDLSITSLDDDSMVINQNGGMMTINPTDRINYDVDMNDHTSGTYTFDTEGGMFITTKPVYIMMMGEASPVGNGDTEYMSQSYAPWGTNQSQIAFTCPVHCIGIRVGCNSESNTLDDTLGTQFLINSSIQSGWTSNTIDADAGQQTLTNTGISPVAQADYISMGMATQSSTSGTAAMRGTCIILATPRRNISFVGSGSNSTVSSGSTIYFTFGGQHAGTSTEALRRSRLPRPMKCSNLSVRINTNTDSATATFKMRKNGADGNMVINIGAGQEGTFQDLQNVDSGVEGDYFTLEFATLTGTSINFRTHCAMVEVR